MSSAREVRAESHHRAMVTRVWRDGEFRPLVAPPPPIGGAVRAPAAEPLRVLRTGSPASGAPSRRRSVLAGVGLGALLLVLLLLGIGVIDLTTRSAPPGTAGSVASSFDREVATVRGLEHLANWANWVVMVATTLVMGAAVNLVLVAPAGAVGPDGPDPSDGRAPAGPLTRAAIRWAAVVALVGIVVSLVLRAGVLNDGPSDTLIEWDALLLSLGSPAGVAGVVRGCGVALLAAAVLAPLPDVRRPVTVVRGGVAVIGAVQIGSAALRRIVVMGAAGLTLSSFVVIGHAQATSPRELLMLADVVHVGAASLWFGGLVVLVLAFRDARRNGPVAVGDRHEIGPSSRRELAEHLTRFSVAAMVSVGLVTLAGCALAWSQLPSIAALWTTAYGVTLSIKLVLVAVVLAMGGLNHRFLVPAVRERDDVMAWRLVRRTIAVEASVIAFGVLLATVALASGGFANWFR